LNHAEPCWFRFAVVKRKTPPLATCGCLGEPSVKTWQAAAGVLLFAHTLLLVNPPAGILKDWAEARTASWEPANKTANVRKVELLPRIIALSP